MGGGDGPVVISQSVEDCLVGALHDQMTQCRYLCPIDSFELSIKPEAVYDVDVIGGGRAALQKANADLGEDLW